MFKNMNRHARGLIIVLSIIVISSLISCVFFANQPGEDYTKDYQLYKKLGEMSNTFELMTYCHEHGIEYAINDKQFELKGYRLSFTLDKEHCTLNNNYHMKYLKLIEDGYYDYADTEQTENGKITTYRIQFLGNKYTMSRGVYTVYNTLPGFFSLIILVFSVISLAYYIFFCSTYCKYCRNTKVEA